MQAKCGLPDPFAPGRPRYGVCRIKPAASDCESECTAIITGTPGVCACDGNVYCNPCLANVAGTSAQLFDGDHGCSEGVQQ
jgi:hypothetical protein